MNQAVKSNHEFDRLNSEEELNSWTQYQPEPLRWWEWTDCGDETGLELTPPLTDDYLASQARGAVGYVDEWRLADSDNDSSPLYRLVWATSEGEVVASVLVP